MEIPTQYNAMLHSYGLPYRLGNGRSFSLLKALKTYEISDDKIVLPKKQESFYKTACKSDTGWTMFICGETFLDRPKHIAANIMQSYFERDLKTRWLTSFSPKAFEKIKFYELKLVVIDALFFDSSNYHRDRIYEVINYNANVPDLSLIVVGKHTDPIAMGLQLGMRFDMGLLCK